MERAADVLRLLTTFGFVALTYASVRQWLRTRERVTGFLSGAFGLLGLVIVLGEVDRLTDERYTDIISIFSLIGFLGSGFLLLMFRHEFIPLRRTTLLATLGALVVLGILVLVYPTPEDTTKYNATD